MNVWYQVPGFLLTAICHVIVIYYMAEHTYCRKKLIGYGIVFTAGFVGMTGLGYAIRGNGGILIYAGIVVWTFFFSCKVSKDCFPQKCFLFITYFCLFSVIDNIVRLAARGLFPQIPELSEYFFRIMIRSAVLLLLLVCYKRYAVPLIRSLTGLNGRRWWNLALIAVLFYMVQAMFSILYVVLHVSSGEALLSFIIISFIMCAVYSLVFSNISYMKKEMEGELMRQNAEYLSNRLSIMQEADERNRRMRHDIRHHLEAIGEYAKTGNVSQILAYIEEYGVEISETAVRQYSVNSVLNSIFSAYAGKASENQIDFLVKCNVPEKLPVKDVELIAMFGNLLENAFHGCLDSGKGNLRIEIYVRLQKNRLMIVCNNTCSDKLKLRENLPEEKGVGISSILSVCRKYDGSLDYSLQDGTCSACAVLNL